MSELIKDKSYKDFLDRVPQMPNIVHDKTSMVSPPWTVFVQRRPEGPWGKKSFWKYKKALKFLYRALELGVHDAALNNKRVATPPPHRMVRLKGQYMMVRGKKTQKTRRVWWKVSTDLMVDQPQHYWCMYCRRPTIFKYFSKHKLLGPVDSTVLRCNICGASERIAIHIASERRR